MEPETLRGTNSKISSLPLGQPEIGSSKTVIKQLELDILKKIMLFWCMQFWTCVQIIKKKMLTNTP